MAEDDGPSINTGCPRKGRPMKYVLRVVHAEYFEGIMTADI